MHKVKKTNVGMDIIWAIAGPIFPSELQRDDSKQGLFVVLLSGKAISYIRATVKRSECGIMAVDMFDNPSMLIQLTPPITPQSNGVAERMNRTHKPWPVALGGGKGSEWVSAMEAELDRLWENEVFDQWNVTINIVLYGVGF